MRFVIHGCLVMLTAMFPGTAAAQYQEVVPMTGYLPGPLGNKSNEIVYPWFDAGYGHSHVPSMSNNVRESAIRGFIDWSGGITAAAGKLIGMPEPLLATRLLTCVRQPAKWMWNQYFPHREAPYCPAGLHDACELYVASADSVFN